jgi:hypothetical protein
MCPGLAKDLFLNTHTYVRPERFKRGQVVGDCADSLNYALYLMIQDIERVELEYIKRGVDVNLVTLKEAVKAHISPAAKLCDFGIEVVKQSDRKDLTVANYKTLLNNIERFRKGALITDID